MPAPATRQRPHAYRPSTRARKAQGPLWSRLLRKVLRTLVLVSRAHPHTTAIALVGTVSAVLLQVTENPAAADSSANGHRVSVQQAAVTAMPVMPSLPAAPLGIAGVVLPTVASPTLLPAAAVEPDLSNPGAAAIVPQVEPALGIEAGNALAVIGDAMATVPASSAPQIAMEISPAAAIAPRTKDTTFSTLAGDPGLQSATALVMDLRTGKPLYAKNDQDVLPIASITKLMTALVVVESRAPLGEVIEITNDDIDRIKSSTSRLRVGAKLTRETLLRLALMASENRAASALSRAYPGGKAAFVAAMNRKAAALGMYSTHFDDPTGLSKTNVSTAHDLVRLVQEDWRNPLMRAFSTSSSLDAQVGRQVLTFNNTNPLLRSPHAGWQISLSKTGYISEAGHCLVMRATVAAREVVIVLLNSQGRYTRIGDANRLRRWMESQPDARRQRIS